MLYRSALCLYISAVVSLLTSQYCFAFDQISETIAVILRTGFAKELKLSGHGFEASQIDQELENFYQERNYRPLWLTNDRPSLRADDARKVILQATTDGFNPADYFITEIQQRFTGRTPLALAQLELFITLGIIRLAAHASEGRFEPREIDLKLFSDEKPILPDLRAVARQVLASDDLAKAIRDRFPVHKQYQRMREALARYKTLELQGGWPQIVIPKGVKVQHGARHQLVLQLAGRLMRENYLPSTYVPLEMFDDTLLTALQRFQRDRGLEQTRYVGPETLRELNVSATERVKTLLINLERWRWLQRDFTEEKEIFVNVAGYELLGLQAGSIQLRLPVIVGKTFHATPIFSSLIQHVEFNPFWSVPNSIASNEILPKLKKDQKYLQTQHMRLFTEIAGQTHELSAVELDWRSMTSASMRRYVIRQEPGEWNALGKMKFIFPNPYSVYLHDTPQRSLFNQRERAFSHGCIRVHEPEKLAIFLLSTPSDAWTFERIQSQVASGEHRAIKLPKPVRVHVSYRTAWVEADGSIHFRKDLYQRDARMAKVMFP